MKVLTEESCRCMKWQSEVTLTSWWYTNLSEEAFVRKSEKSTEYTFKKWHGKNRKKREAKFRWDGMELVSFPGLDQE